ncbi:MAG: DUF4911 domain-containing protein [Deltaproteobacteria bacterium]|nr:DUF4911 domain-containing protein [Deltaproteobacteria bacterium]
MNHQEKYFVNPPTQTTRLKLRISKNDMVFLKSIIESYDDAAVLRTIDAETGLMELLIGPGWESTVAEILEDLKSGMPLILLDEESGDNPMPDFSISRKKKPQRARRKSKERKELT